MVPQVSIEFDKVEMARLIDNLDKTADSCGLTVQWLIWDCARVAANNCIKYTAPWAGGQKAGNAKSQRSTGEAAITYDLVGKKGGSEGSRKGLFGFLTAAMTLYEEFNGGGKLPNFNLVKLKSGAVYLVDKNFAMPGASSAELQRIHLAHRTANGRVSTAGQKDRKVGRWKAKHKYFAPESVVRGYVKSVQNRVGKLKAGWLVAARHFAGKTGGKVNSSAWIDRHGDSGTYTDTVKRTGNGAAVLTNTPAHRMAIRPSFEPFINRLTNKYLDSLGIPGRFEKIAARFRAGQSKAEAVKS